MPRLNAFGQPIGDPLPGWTPVPFPPHTAIDGRYCRVEPLAPAHAPGLWDAFQEDDGRNWTYLAPEPFTRGTSSRPTHEHAAPKRPRIYADFSPIQAVKTSA